MVDGKWKITWYNQEVGWDDNDTTTGQKWNGTFHVKAKENYLGGNLIETNDNASFQATGIKLVINGTPESNWRPLPDSMPQLPYSVPRVNVHNLETDKNSTEWTVYKGTSVTPKEQLEALWNAIPIEEVVRSTVNSAHKITTGSGANVGSQGTGETFTLASLISEVAPSFDINSLINQITVSKSSASQEFIYAAYGHESGKITVTVERTVGNQMPATHTADTVGALVEQYKVTFTYTPYTEDERMNGKVKDPTDTDHHNGSGGRGAEETGTITSTNTHVINVFAKKLKIEKVDQARNTITGTNSTAEFGLYRKATTAEEADNSVTKVSLTGLTGNYVLVQTLTTEGGTVTTDALPLLKGTEEYDEPYYLVETKAPAGYNMLTDVLKVSIDMSESSALDHNTWTKKSDSLTSHTKPNPYVLSDWLQEATIKVTALNGENSSYAIRVIPEGEHGITYDHTNDTTNASVTYKIINNAGYELPSTGGPGIHLFTILGSILICLAGASLLLMRRRIRA